MTLKRIGFRVRGIYKMRKPRVMKIAKQKLSFTVATLSLLAFVVGNMVGQHGWYSFWKTVLGKEDDSLIAFVGTVSPIEKIPDYTLWSQYGGNKQVHTYGQAPSQVLKELPSYDQTSLRNGSASKLALQAYSTLWEGGYNSPNGSHAGVDIDAPRGTPVVAIANGVVEMTSEQSYGFGNHVMIRHPNVPDATSEGGKTTLYSTYAHLDVVLVQPGEVVHKGQQIGTVGNTGLVFGATGYHLYFQVEKQDAPFHPYWPFTSGEIAADGMSFVQAVNSTKYQSRLHEYTLSPMAFVQQYKTYVRPSVATTTGTAGVAAAQVSTSTLTTAERMKSLANTRLKQRLAKAGQTATIVVQAVSSSASSVAQKPQEVTQVTVTAAAAPDVPSSGTNTDVDHLRIEHSGKVSHVWQKVRIFAVDKHGDTVASPSFSGRLYVISEFGEAEIRPAELSPLDFVNGVATVNILSRSNKTLFISTRGAFTTTSAPMLYDR